MNSGCGSLLLAWRRIGLGVLVAGAMTASTARAAGPVVSDQEALSALNLNDPDLKAVKAAANTGNMEAAKQAYLAYRRTTSKAKWLVMPSDMPKAPVAKEDALGDEVCNHIIRDAYNKARPPVDMGKDFDWRRNPTPKSSPDFSNEWTFCSVARTFFWKTLAAAYWKTHDEKYAREWVAQLMDFTTKVRSDANIPYNEGSLWRTLDASERMNDSWPDAYYHFLNSPSFTPEAQWVYLRSMVDHGRFLRQGLRDPKRSGNWVTSECYGLYAIGALFPELKEAQAWRDFAMARLASDLEKVVPPDGFEAELTPNYHYFTLSSYAGPMKLARLNRLPVPANFESKLLAMYQAPLFIMDQRFRCVAVNDSGDDNAAAWSRQGLSLFGNDPTLQWAASEGKKGTPLPVSTMLPYAGFYAMRSGWQPRDMFLFFRAGPTGLSHEHEDMLQVVLHAFGKPLLIEPGSYDYDHSDWRRYAIGTASHNTIIVDGKWQHRGPSPVPVARPMTNAWLATPLVDYVAGTYNAGYQENVLDSTLEYRPEKWIGNPDRSVAHTRHVFYLRPYYALVVDLLTGKGNHTYDAHFHMDAPAAEIDPATQVALSKNTNDVQIGLFPVDRARLQADVIQGQKDPLLGWVPKEHRAIPTIRYRKEGPAPMTFATLLYPFRGEAPQVTADPFWMHGRVWAAKITTPKEQAVVAMTRDQYRSRLRFYPPTFDDMSVDASGWVARKLTGHEEVLNTAWDLTFFSADMLKFECDTGASLAWVQQNDRTVLMYNAGADPVTVRVTWPFTVRATVPSCVWTRVSLTGAAPAEGPVMPDFDP